jgi:hypothetical protein
MSTNETTKSLLHYNECAADSGAHCTCEPPLTTIEEVTALLFACHVLEFIDAEAGWACGCDEDGFLELLTLEDAHKHQAEAALAVVAPLIKADAYSEAAGDLDAFASYHEGAFSDDWMDGVRSAQKLIAEQSDALHAKSGESR